MDWVSSELANGFLETDRMHLRPASPPTVDARQRFARRRFVGLAILVFRGVRHTDSRPHAGQNQTPADIARKYDAWSGSVERSAS